MDSNNELTDVLSKLKDHRMKLVREMSFRDNSFSPPKSSEENEDLTVVHHSLISEIAELLEKLETLIGKDGK